MSDEEFPSVRRADVAARTPHSSRIQQLHPPPLPLSHVGLSLVQPTWHSAPELDSIRNDAEAGPEGRTRYRAAGESLGRLGDARVQLVGGRQRATLARGPSADLAAARTGGEIGVRFRRVHRLRLAFDAHLA